MLERFTKLRETVEAVLTVDGPVLSRMEWTAVKMLVDVLKPFNDASEKLSGSSYATISMFLPVMASLATLPDPSFTFEEEDVTMVSDEEASDLLTALKALSASLRSGIRGRLKAMPLETTQFLLEAAFLDPRQKSLWFLQRACEDSAVLSDILPAVERGTIGTSAGGATGAALLERVMKSLKTQLTRSLRDAASVTDGAGVEGGDPGCDFPPPSKIRRGTAGTIFSGIASSATSGSASRPSEREVISEEVNAYAAANPLRLFAAVLSATDPDNKWLKKRREGAIDDDEFLESMDPIVFWRNSQEKYPMLGARARSVLSCPASSVPSECLWSDFGRVLCDDRCRLSAEHAEALVLCKREMKAPKCSL
jgi:hypothetical protein